MNIAPVEDDCVTINIFNLRLFLERFKKSVSLFELLERGGDPQQGVFGGVFIEYRMIAARDGALNIYHFGCSLEAIKKQRPTSRRYSSELDGNKIRDALKEFKRLLPGSDSVRNAIAHTGELCASPEKIKRNTQRRDYLDVNGGFFQEGGIMLVSFQDRRYSVGIEGDIFTVYMNEDSIKSLEKIVKLVDAARLE